MELTQAEAAAEIVLAVACLAPIPPLHFKLSPTLRATKLHRGCQVMLCCFSVMHALNSVMLLASVDYLRMVIMVFRWLGFLCLGFLTLELSDTDRRVTRFFNQFQHGNRVMSAAGGSDEDASSPPATAMSSPSITQAHNSLRIKCGNVILPPEQAFSETRQVSPSSTTFPIVDIAFAMKSPLASVVITKNSSTEPDFETVRSVSSMPSHTPELRKHLPRAQSMEIRSTEVSGVVLRSNVASASVSPTNSPRLLPAATSSTTVNSNTTFLNGAPAPVASPSPSSSPPFSAHPQPESGSLSNLNLNRSRIKIPISTNISNPIIIHGTPLRKGPSSRAKSSRFNGDDESSPSPTRMISLPGFSPGRIDENSHHQPHHERSSSLPRPLNLQQNLLQQPHSTSPSASPRAGTPTTPLSPTDPTADGFVESEHDIGMRLLAGLKAHDQGFKFAAVYVSPPGKHRLINEPSTPNSLDSSRAASDCDNSPSS